MSTTITIILLAFAFLAGPLLLAFVIGWLRQESRDRKHNIEIEFSPESSKEERLRQLKDEIERLGSDVLVTSYHLFDEHGKWVMDSIPKAKELEYVFKVRVDYHE